MLVTGVFAGQYHTKRTRLLPVKVPATFICADENHLIACALGCCHGRAFRKNRETRSILVARLIMGYANIIKPK